jgi:transmembrane sensor
MEAKNRLNYLLERFNNGNASPDELSELEGLLADPEATGQIQQLWDKLPEDAYFFEEDKSETMLAEIVQRNRTADRLRKQRRTKQVLLIAATLVFAVAGVLVFKAFQPAESTAPIAEQSKISPPVIPGDDKAILVLDDGSTVTLDNTANGNITKQGSSNISKANGQVTYALNDAQDETPSVVYNTIKIPRGGQYQLVLADGTKVWMNASSSLHFPTSFPGKERVVELTGEAYFEVAKDAQRRFSVKVNGTTVNVLGTHFNVMAYDNESAMAVTLMEGSVNVAKENDNVTLRPGQQAQLKPGANFSVVNNVNLEETLAWKNGYFHLDHTTLAVLMRQIV